MPIIQIGHVGDRVDRQFVKRVLNGVLGAHAVHHVSMLGQTARASLRAWPDTPMADWARGRLECGKEVRIVYDPPVFWRCRLV